MKNDYKFGKWTVIKKTDLKDISGTWMWECRCECGKIKAHSTSTIKLKRTLECRSCSMSRIKRKKDPEEVVLNSLYLSYKHRAKKKNLEFNIPKNEFMELIKCNCLYCDSPPDKRHIKLFNNYAFANGLDRFDNSKGYTWENVAPCCAKCNRMKLDYTFEDFKNHILKLAEKLKVSDFFPNIEEQT